MRRKGEVVRRIPGRLSLVLSVLIVALVATTVATMAVPPQASAAVTMDLRSHEIMYHDSNKPNTEGPRASYLCWYIYNDDSVNTLYDVTVDFTGFYNPSVTPTSPAAPLFADPSDKQRVFNSLGPNEGVAVYFYVDFYGASVYGATLSPKSWTGLSADYDIVVNAATTPGGTLSQVYDTGTRTVSMASSISANAGGSDVSSILGPGVYVGQILSQTVVYKFGNNEDVSFQPIGITGFEDGVFRLVGSELTNISGYSTNPDKSPTGINIGDKDRLYWPGSDVPDSGTEFEMTYYWEVLEADISSIIHPWAIGLSGNDFKYLMDPTGSSELPAADPAPLAVSKTVDPTYFASGPGTVTYTVEFTNTLTDPPAPYTPSDLAITLSQIVDELPYAPEDPDDVSMVDSTYTGSEITTANSSQVPAENDTQTVTWKGAGARYDNREYQILPGETLTLVYTADVEADAAEGYYTNDVYGVVGKEETAHAYDSFQIGGTPTLAVVSDFRAYAVANGVAVVWETASELRTAGYYIERFDGNSKKWKRVQSALVPALLESPIGGRYGLTDHSAHVGETYSYRVVEVEVDGKEFAYGPYEVTAHEDQQELDVARGLIAGDGIARLPELPEQASSQAEAARNKGLTKKAGSTRLRVEVEESGLYQIPAVDIAGGLEISEQEAAKLIKNAGLSLTSAGKTVAYLPAADGSSLYFYGEAIESLYAAHNVYWLAQGKGTVMSDVKLPKVRGSVSTTITQFVDTVHAEENTFAYPELTDDPGTDIWIWTYLVAGYAPLQTKTLTLEAPETVSGLDMEVELWGLTDTAHQVEVRLNGVSLGGVTWSGRDSKTAGFAIPEGVLVPGSNQITLVASLGDSVPYSIVGIESLDLTYERTTHSNTGSLLMSAPSTGFAGVYGLDASSGAQILDISDPKSPQVASWVGVSDGGDSGLKFAAIAGQTYLAVDGEGVMEPVALTATLEPTLTEAGRGAEYVIITAPALEQAAERYGAYRASQGLTTEVVTTSEIYDEFNHGIADPQAVQDFLKLVVTKWKPEADYVLLAGEGSLDFKDYLGYGDCLVPSLVVDAGDFLVPSDGALADIFGHDGLSEVAIGRIPAADSAELDAVLAKVKAYEASQGDWRNSVLLAADNPDDGGDFYVQSDSIAGVLPSSLFVAKAYLGQVSVAETRASIARAFAEGSLVVSYVGHASSGQLASEKLLTTGTVASLPTSSKLPVLTAYSCFAGNFGMAGYDGLAEALVMKSGAGSVAVWAPAGREMSTDSTLLGRLFASGLFDSSHTSVLGDVIQEAKAAAKKAGLSASTLQDYGLVGDPALRVAW